MEEVKGKINQIDKEYSSNTNENSDKRIKSSYIKEVITQIQKLFNLIFNSFSKYNKDLFFYSTNLKKVFDFMTNEIYSGEYSSNSFYSGNFKMPSNKNKELSCNYNAYECKYIHV